MYEKLKFSNLRNLYLFIFYLVNKFLNLINFRNDLWGYDFKILDGESFKNKILVFCPSLSLDKPSYLNVGIKALINTAKYKNINIDLIQCQKSLAICHLGGSPFSYKNKMPCLSCTSINKRLYKDTNIIKLENIKKNDENDLENLSLEELLKYNYKGFELGKLATSSIIWIKRTPLLDKKDVGYFKKIIKDSIGLIDYFEGLNLKDYSAVLVFNGASFPESILYEFCKKQNINVATFEGGLSYKNKFSIEFNYGITAQHRFKFDQSLDFNSTDLFEDPNLMKTQYVDGENVKENYFDKKKVLNINGKKIVSVFGNVSWDTSQYISNTIFLSMFDWLESLKELIKSNPDYLFIFRAHPGENRRLKKTFYGMGQWLEDNNIQDFENAIIVNSDDKIDSYEIINKSNLVLVYNSTIGIESTMMGKKSYVAASTHYSDQPFVMNFNSKQAYIEQLKTDLKTENFKISETMIQLSKSYYYQLFNHVSYPLDNLIIKADGKQLEVKNDLIDDRKYLLNSQFNNLLENLINNRNIQAIS
tara:strand:+ start:11938 stop:13533 length:1596 start_codon:yes stop_codon:yes gene_type:complete